MTHKKVYLEHIYGYPEDEIYSLAYRLGRELINYIGRDLFLLLLDSRILLQKHKFKTSEESWQLHPASKCLEGYLAKLISRKKLYEDKNDDIGDVFGRKSNKLRRIVKNKKLIEKTKSTWSFCRNDIMHYQKNNKYRIMEMNKRYEEILDTVIYLFEDLYTKSDPDDEIRRGFKRHVSAKFKSNKYRIKERAKRLIDRI